MKKCPIKAVKVERTQETILSTVLSGIAREENKGIVISGI